MSITRRSFLAGLGSVSVGLLFRARLDAVLDSLEQELVADPVVQGQAPSAVDIVVQAQSTFRPDRLVIASDIAPSFVLEDIHIGGVGQLCSGSAVPAELFSPSALDSPMVLSVVGPGGEIRFRVRYVGADPGGARFRAALIGTASIPAPAPAPPPERRLPLGSEWLPPPARLRQARTVLAIDSGGPIVA